jgi:hypothetical protein
LGAEKAANRLGAKMVDGTVTNSVTCEDCKRLHAEYDAALTHRVDPETAKRALKRTYCGRRLSAGHNLTIAWSDETPTCPTCDRWDKENEPNDKKEEQHPAAKALAAVVDGTNCDTENENE